MNILSLQRQLTCPRGQSLSRRFAQNWTPAALGSALALWLDADDASTIVLNGSTVSQWSDKSGNGRNATQAIAASQPTRTLSGLNGKTVLTFDGMDDFLNAGTTSTWNFLHNGSSSAVAFVGQMGQPTTPSTKRMDLFNTGGSSSVYSGYFLNFGINDTQVRSNASRGVSGTISFTLVTSFPQRATPVILINRVDADNPTASQRTIININGGGDVGGNTSTSSASSANSGIPLNIGSSGSTGFVGFLSEIIFVNSELSLADHQHLEGYLAWKWGLQGNLPANHPFKNSPPTV
jgi:hypothetical protein